MANFGKIVIPETGEKNAVMTYKDFGTDGLINQLDQLQAEKLQHRAEKLQLRAEKLQLRAEKLQLQVRDVKELELIRAEVLQLQVKEANEFELIRIKEELIRIKEAKKLELEKQKTIRMSSNSISGKLGSPSL